MRTRRGFGMLTALAVALAVVPPAGARLAPAGGRPSCFEPIAEAPKPPGIVVDLTMPSQDLAPGDPVRLKVTVRNEGLLPVSYNRSGQTHDFWIADEEGRIWVWSQGRVFTQPLIYETLAPGEQRSGRTRWGSLCRADGRGRTAGLPGPGSYVARALWVSNVEGDERAWWSDEVPFRIRRR